MAKENEKDNDQEEDKTVRITYIGDDISYWKNIQERFKEEYPDLESEQIHLPAGEAVEVKEMLPKIIENKSRIIYLDYSVNTPEMMRLAHNMRREAVLKDMVVVGLLESLESKRLITLSLSLGIYLNMVKSGEMSSIVHHPMVIAYPEIAKDTDYAVAKVEFLAQAFSQMRVGYFSDTYVHMESSHKFDDGKDLFLKTSFFVDCKLSGNFKIVRCFDDNIYSTHNYAYDLEYNHMDMEQITKSEVNLTAAKTELARDPKNSNLKYDVSQREGELNQAKADATDEAKEREQIIKDWIKTSSSKEKAKRTRVLIIDRQMDFLKEGGKHLDNFSFSMQYHSRIDESVVRKVRPGIIAFNIDLPPMSSGEKEEKPESETKDETEAKTDTEAKTETEEKSEADTELAVETKHLNDLNELKKLCTTVKDKGIDPFIIVYNAYGREAQIKEAVPCKRLMITTDPITLDSISKFAEMYEAKGGREQTHDQSKSYAKQEKREYINKFDAKALAQFQFPITVKEISETELVFSCEEHIPHFSMLYIKRPVKMTITVVPAREGSSMKVDDGDHYGLVSGLGEVELADLRIYINQLFFTELEEKKRQEKSEFEELNKQKEGEKAEAEALEKQSAKENKEED